MSWFGYLKSDNENGANSRPRRNLPPVNYVEDEDDWATSDELADDDNDSNAVVAESALDRYSFVLIRNW